MTDDKKIRQLEQKLSEYEKAPDVEIHAKIDIMNDLAWEFIDTDPTQAQTLAQEAHSLATSIENGAEFYPLGIAYSLRTSGYLNQRLGNYPLGLSQLLEAQTIFESLDHSDGLPDVFDGIAGIYYQLSDFPGALEYTYKQLAVAQHIADQRRIANAYNNMAAIFNETGDYERSVDILRDNLQMAVETGYKRIESLSHMNLTEAYLAVEDYDKALEHGEASLHINQGAGFEQFEVYSLNLIGETYLKMGEAAQALHFLGLALDLSRRLELKPFEALILINFGKAYRADNQNDRAIERLSQGISVAQSIEAKGELSECHLLLSEIFQGGGDLDRVLFHFKEYHSIKESIFNDKADQRLKVLKVVYETETSRKEAEILRLRTVELTQEISEREQAEALLRESESKFRNFVEQSSDGIILVDERGHIIEWNKGAELLTGLKQDAVLDTPLWDVQVQLLPEEQITPDARERYKAMISQALQTGEAPWLDRLIEANYQDADRSLKFVHQRFFPIQTRSGFWLGAISTDITSSKEAEIVLNQQFTYQQALASCSQALLVPVEGESDQQNVLNQALEHLRSATEASRAFVIRVFNDPEDGLCVGILAEVCAPGIHAHIDNPRNQKVPLDDLPLEMVSSLASGKPYGGPVKQVIASKPDLLNAFLSQKIPLLSLIYFPIFDRDRWRGFVGFDDCTSERVWNEMEISILRTASEMIGTTLQRWRTADQLKETLDHLEDRVEERTAKLSEEIQGRQRVQSDLETRLLIEELLTTISTRLLEQSRIRENIAASMEDLARIMNAGRIFLVEFDLKVSNQVRDFIEWRRPEVLPISRDVVRDSMTSLIGLRDRLWGGETVYIADTNQSPHNDEIDLRFLQDRDIHSIVLAPIVIDQRLQAVLGCSNLQSSAEVVQMNLRALELVAGMLQSLFQRERLIQTLEEQVAERTRQLTTFLDVAILSDQSQDLNDILQPTLRSISQIVEYDALGTHIVDKNSNSLTLIAQVGIPPDFLEWLRVIELDAGLAAWLDETESSQALSQPDPEVVFPEQFCLPDYQAYFSVRLRAGNKTLGILNCYRSADQPFSPFQRMLLTALGDLLGIIIENYHLRIEGQELATVEERQRLAREIHDAVSQSVYSLSLFARSANDALDEANREKLSTNLQDIETTAIQAMREMRLLLYQLRETGPEKDIAAALDARFRQVENRLGIEATHDIGADIYLPMDIQHEVWRIIIEALNNVVKHANATIVHVKIANLDANLVTSIRDDGIGFDDRDRSYGMGLKNMQTRAEALGGRLDITSSSGQGTQINLKVPLAYLEAGEGD